MERALIGDWFGTAAGKPVRLEFKVDGHLDYEIGSNGHRQIMLLAYRVDGDVILTDQPSHAQEERTAFRFDGDGKLVLSFGGIDATFQR